MKQNIVLIETVENIGTGIIYPCNYDNEDFSDCNSFIIFTNRHVLSDIEEECGPNKNLKEFIILQIFDYNGNIIRKEHIKKIEIYLKTDDREYYNDIASLLILIDNSITLELETKIYQKQLEDREVLYMEGYPGVMLDDEINQKIQLEGKNKIIFPANNYVGVYQISDEYHWYNNYKDLKLMEGFSGSPVYKLIDKSTYILGMNQSIANIENGENPFKLVYYLKMNYVLNYLREAGCIIYSKIDENSYHIEWIYGLHKKMEGYPNKSTLLLLGGSGAGKSSFAKDFALHGDKLNSTNDGQTTRTNVIYNFKIFSEKNEMDVQLMKQIEFTERIKKLNKIKPILFVYYKLFGFSEFNRIESNVTYLSNMYYFIECILLSLKGKGKKLLDNIQDIFLMKKNNDPEKLSDLYIEVAEHVLNNFPCDQIKYVCDKDTILKLHKMVQKKNQYKQLFRVNSKQDIESARNEFNSMVKRVWNTKVDKSVEDVLFDECMNINFDYEKYQKRCYEQLKGRVDNNNIYKILEYMNNDDILKELYTIILTVDGFFNISEFNYIFSEQEFKNAISEVKEKLFNVTEKNKVKFNFDKLFTQCCNVIYTKLSKAIKQNLRIENNLLKINLKEITEEKKQLITRCLQVKDDESITGIIKSVKIYDSISNEYALLMKELKMSELTIIDTHGLDHVEWDASKKDILEDAVFQYKDDKEIEFDKNIGVLYIKKLDSGRPNEIKNILPYVYEIIPKAPVYCVFSGIDIFYSLDEKQIGKINWGEKNKFECPKSVKYILSSSGKEEIIQNISCSDERKENFYSVLKNNIVAYCGRKELVETKFNYYLNNTIQIRKLLTSIIMKEFSSLEIIDRDEVKKILEKEEVKKKAIILLGRIFKEASVTTWSHFHHMTTKANFERTSKREELGFWGVKHHQWNQLFSNAFNYVMSNENSEFLSEFNESKDAIESSLINMGTKLLGTGENLHSFNLKQADKNPFRILLEKMYSQKSVYKNNPFDDQVDLSRASQDQKKEYLNDVVDFWKGFSSNSELQEEFFDFFKETLLLQIEEDNNVKSKNLIELNISFSKALKELENEFIDKYNSGGKHEAKAKFHMLLSYYLENNTENK